MQRFVLPLIFGCGLSVVCKLRSQYIKFGVAASRFHAPWCRGIDRCKLATLCVMPLLDYLTRDYTRLWVGCLFIKIEKGYYWDFFLEQPFFTPCVDQSTFDPTRICIALVSRDLYANSRQVEVSIGYDTATLVCGRTTPFTGPRRTTFHFKTARPAAPCATACSPR